MVTEAPLKAKGCPGGSDGKESVWDAGDISSIPGLGRSPGEGDSNPLPVSLPGESHGQRSLAGYSVVYEVARVRHNLETNTLKVKACSQFRDQRESGSGLHNDADIRPSFCTSLQETEPTTTQAPAAS